MTLPRFASLLAVGTSSVCLALTLGACGSEDEGNSGGGAGGAAMGLGGEAPSAGGNTPAAGGMPGSGGTPDPMNVGGMAMQGAGGASSPGGGAHVPGQEPIIPQPTGDCPDFTAGNQNIMGLDTVILAGTPGATKGPLLFNWHGTGGNGDQAMRQLPQSVRDEIVAMGGLVIAPSSNGQMREGQDVTVGLNVWYSIGDLKYADQIVACAVQNHNIDPKQIYVTGCSAGGLMTGVMSILRSNYVASAATNSGGILGVPDFEDPSRVPSAMTMHGGAGDNVIVNFGDTSHNYQNALKAAGATTVIECNHMIGHCGAPQDLYVSAWEFLKAHPFGVSPSPYAGGLPGTFPAYCQLQ